MKRLTIQARLTAWYFLSLAVIISLLAGGSWFAMKASMYHAIDRDLRYRMSSVAPFVQSYSRNTREGFTRMFSDSADSSIVGVLVQITDDQSKVLYESDVLRTHNVPALTVGNMDGSLGITTTGEYGWPIRVASQRFVLRGIGLTIHVAEPLRDLMGSLREYRLYLALLVLFALPLTTTVGYWMSRRALAPVERIRKEAEAIDPAVLTSRLHVPPSDDGLARLAQTLNAMMSRIETSFRSIERFTADASHELRAPLALITTACQVSLRKERSREELSEVLRKILGEAKHMSRLVENLLDLARNDARRRYADASPVDVTQLLRDLCVEMNDAANAKGLTLYTEVPATQLCTMGEATELRRLFLILLDNAIKYTATG